MILKTFLLSQINYIGCFLPPTQEKLELIQNLLDGFVRKNITISNNRMHKPTEEGDMGIPLVEFFSKHSR